jgi:two-component sensor histidine kinase
VNQQDERTDHGCLERLDRIEFAEYAETLVHDLLVSYAAEGSQVQGSFQLSPVDLHIEQAVPCGLILNELVTNVLKYAYPGGTPGTVSVSLECLAGDKLSLSVGDGGPGLPEGLDWKKSPSMGASIVRLLTRQLGGTLNVESSSAGTTISIVFTRMTE